MSAKSVNKKELLSVYEGMLGQGVDIGTVILMMRQHINGVTDVADRRQHINADFSDCVEAVEILTARIAELETKKAVNERRATFYESLKNHQISGKGTVGYSQIVTLTASDNTYIKYPARGCLTIIEQGTDLSPIVAVFRHLNNDGSLGVAVEARKPKYTFDGETPASFKPDEVVKTSAEIAAEQVVMGKGPFFIVVHDFGNKFCGALSAIATAKTAHVCAVIEMIQNETCGPVVVVNLNMNHSQKDFSRLLQLVLDEKIAEETKIVFMGDEGTMPKAMLHRFVQIAA